MLSCLTNYSQHKLSLFGLFTRGIYVIPKNNSSTYYPSPKVTQESLKILTFTVR